MVNDNSQIRSFMVITGIINKNKLKDLFLRHIYIKEYDPYNVNDSINENIDIVASINTLFDGHLNDTFKQNAFYKYLPVFFNINDIYMFDGVHNLYGNTNNKLSGNKFMLLNGENIYYELIIVGSYPYEFSKPEYKKIDTSIVNINKIFNPHALNFLNDIMNNSIINNRDIFTSNI